MLKLVLFVSVKVISTVSTWRHCIASCDCLVSMIYLSKGMKDTAPGPVPYSVYGKLWVTAGPLVLEAWKYSNEKGERN